MRKVITLDGPAGAGKGTLARHIAEHFDLPYLDTGLIYRALAQRLLAKDWQGAPEQALQEAEAFRPDWLTQEGLRSSAVGAVASQIASLPAVRRALLNFQRRFAQQPKGAVLDGRDTGTVVCPDAALKLYIVASLEIRAKRRLQELHETGERVTERGVMEKIRQRDARDSGRTTAPMLPAHDAVILDSSNLSIHEAAAMAVALVKVRFSP